MQQACRDCNRVKLVNAKVFQRVLEWKFEFQLQMYFIFNLLEAFHHHNTALNNILKLRINLWLDF